MLHSIISFSIRNKLIIGLLVLTLIGYGMYQVTQLPIDAVPDITNNQVQVITVASSFGASDIERLVTFPIEQATSNISGIEEIRSFSRFGLSLVTIVFTDETDLYWARQQVSERLQKVQSEIPAGIGTPELGPISTGLGEIYQYVIKPKKGYENTYDATELRTIQDWIVRRQLLGVKGVAEVSSFGGKLKQYEVAIDANKLNANQLSIQDVFLALEQNNQNTGGAYIEKGPTVQYIRSEGLIQGVEDIKSISIAQKEGGSPIFIRDIAEVKLGFATRYGAMTFNDLGEVSGAVVMMLKGANSNEVIQNIKDRVEKIQKTLPEGVEIEPFLDRTKMVNNAIQTVEKNLLEGALIVVFVLVLFLGNFRAGLLVASVIPLAMLFAICMMNAFGVSGNLMSLGALDFGLIVDGAVIIVEAVMHHLSNSGKLQSTQKLNQQQMDKIVEGSASKMMNSAVFGQMIILMVYLPIFTLQGIEGKMFKPMAQTVAFALLGAFILSLTYIPMMSAFFLSKKTKKEKNVSDRMMHQIELFFQSKLVTVLRYPKMVLTGVVILFLSSIVLLTTLGGEFIPELEEGDFAIETRVLTGSNLNTSIEAATKAAKVLLTFPEVEKVVSKIGSGEVPTDPMPMEAQDLMTILKPQNEWKTATSFNDLADTMSKALSAIPGVSFDFQYPVQMRFNELMTGAKQDVVCKIFGENLDTLTSLALKLGTLVSSVDGAQDPYVEAVTGMPEIIIKYNRSMIAQYHMSINEINKVINTAFAGQTTGLVFEDEKRFDLVVRLDADVRKNMNDVQNLLIPTPMGAQIPLHQLAEIRVQNGPNQIQREDAKRRIVVGFNIEGRDVQSIVHELQEKVDQKIAFPPGYYVTYGGAFENLEKAKARLLIAVPVSLLLIFILLFFAFHSVKQGLLIYSAIPLSAMGGIVFLALRGMPFSISAGVGFIALFGVAVLNGIVLIAEFNRLKASGIQSIIRIVVSGTKTRLRPVLMTAFVASLGFLPMAFSHGAGSEVQRPLATVVMGGLLLATLLTLFVLPLLYLLFEKGAISKSKNNVLLLFVIFCGHSIYSQETITLDHALEQAIKNSHLVKQEQLNIAYQQALLKTAYEIPKTNIYGEYGQINSFYKDTKFGVSQSFAFPSIYQKQKKVYQSELKANQWSLALKEAEIKKTVYTIFYRHQFLKDKLRLLIQADSIFSAFQQKSTLRMQLGESNTLEVSMAEAQKGSIHFQKQQVENDLELILLELQWVLNVNTKYIPQEISSFFTAPVFIDSAQVVKHPTIQFFAQQKEVAQRKVSLEKSRFLPDINFGYNNTSFIGIGADDRLYQSSDRFQSAQIGLGIPLFFKSTQANIKRAIIFQAMAEETYQWESFSMHKEYQKLRKTYDMQLEMVQYIQKTGQQNAKKMIQTATSQLSQGEINYLDWVILVHQSITLQDQYLEAVKAYNETILEIQFIHIK